MVRETLIETFSDRLKYLSSSYRANGKALPILSNLRGRPESENGFLALNGRMKVPIADDRPTPAPSPLKLKHLHQMAQSCRASGTKLIFVNSPRFLVGDIEKQEHAAWRAQMAEILKPYPDVEFLEINAFSHRDTFQRPELFRDSGHLNRDGSEMFSRMLADELKQRLATGRLNNSAAIDHP